MHQHTDIVKISISQWHNDQTFYFTDKKSFLIVALWKINIIESPKKVSIVVVSLKNIDAIKSSFYYLKISSFLFQFLITNKYICGCVEVLDKTAIT